MTSGMATTMCPQLQGHFKYANYIRTKQLTQLAIAPKKAHCFVIKGPKQQLK